MKKSDVDAQFYEPTRQSLVAILLIVVKTYRVIVRQVWPFLILFLVKGDSFSKKNHFIIGLVAFACIGMVYSIINYFRYYFYIDKDELVIESGVFKRSKLNVPFDRIQTINFEQNIIHRIFNVVRLKVDTAGSAQAEFNFQAIDQKKADDLRNLLLSKKKVDQNVQVEKHVKTKAQEYKTIMRLDVGDLLKAGMVENHLKSGGIIIAFLFWIYQSIEDLGMYGKMEKTISSQISGGIIIAGILVILFFVLSFIYSMIKMIITNYDLKFMRSKTGFKINAGLFTKKDTSAMDHKIQVVSWSDNPLKKLIGIKDLRLKQASSIVMNKKTSIRIPSCQTEHIDLVTQTLYGENAIGGINYSKIDPRYFYRNGGRIALLFVLIAGLLFFFKQYMQGAIASVVGVLFVLHFYLSYRKKRYGFNDEMIVIRGGTYGDKTEILPIYKIQSLSRTQNPYQSRKQLASLVINTASGRVGIPYISNEKVKFIMDTFLYKIEKDRRKWM